jgi:hypothetical protein
MMEVRTVTTDEVVKELLNLVREMRDSGGDVWARRVKNIADAIRKTEREKKEQLASVCGGVLKDPCCVKHWNLEANKNLTARLSRPFITCTICGNKRCPKASDCSLECTNSNEPGQEGSVY